MITTDFRAFPYSKVVRHVSANDDVHTVAEFYSWLMDLFDEPGYMAYETPIKYNTPTSYTMLNGWFLDNGDGSNILEYLTGGSINTSGYADDVLVLDYDTITTDFVAGDKDKEVEDDGSGVGPLLAFLTDYETAGKGRIWVRDTEGNGVIGDGSSITISGSAEVDADGASVTGDEVYTNVYTIASFAGTPNPQVYVRQNHPKSDAYNTRIAEWSNADNWDRGAEGLDVLIPVKIGGAAIDTGKLAIYVRQVGDTFTHTEATVSTTDPARTPIATETAPDINVTQGEHYLLYDAGSFGSFAVGDVIQNVPTSSVSPPDWYAEVVAVETFSDDTTGILTLRGLRGTIADNDTIYVGDEDEGTCTGTPGGTRLDWDAEVANPTTLGQTLTGTSSGAKRLLRGVDIAEDVAVCQVDETVVGSDKDVYYKDFEDNEQVTGSSEGDITVAGDSTSIVSDFTDITIAHVSGTVVVSSIVGTFEVGEVVSWNGATSFAIFLATNGTNEITLGNVDPTDEPDNADAFLGESSGATANCDSDLTDEYKEGFEFPLQTTGSEYATVIECGTVYFAGRSLADVYAYIQYRCRDGEEADFYTSDGSTITLVNGQFYIKAYGTYTAIKTAPFGTLAGGVLFGAQGVWVEGMVSGDANNVKLTDHAGAAQEPYTSITVAVTNTRVSDDIVVLPEDGSTGLPDKDQFTVAAGQTKSDSTLSKDGAAFPNDTPSNGWVYVVATGENEEHKYRYTSWSGTQLTLAAEVDGTADSATIGQTLSADVFGSGVERGDIIRRTTDDAWCYVISVESANEVITTVLSDGTDWEVGDTFEVNSLVQNYDTGDTMYIPYLEAIETVGTDGAPGEEEEVLTFVSNRNVVIRVRNVLDATYKIQPFVTTNIIRDTGMSQAVIRTADEVYS